MPLVSTRCKRAGGFTFLELIVALAVAGITLTGALPA
ncbi:type II secretion system protein, partial [Halomonas sp. 707D4]